MLWKLKLLKAGANYANSRLHAIKAEVLILARFLLSLSLFFICYDKKNTKGGVNTLISSRLPICLDLYGLDNLALMHKHDFLH